MTGSDAADGDDEAVDVDADLDALHPVSTVLRSVQHGGRETDASADAAEEQSVGDAPEMEMDPDGLNEVQPVSSELRSVQHQPDAGDDDDDVNASDVDGSGGVDD